MECTLTEPDGSVGRITNWYHRDMDEYLGRVVAREVEIIKEGSGQFEGMSYVRAKLLGWVSQNGLQSTRCKWVPNDTLWFMTDDKKEML